MVVSIRRMGRRPSWRRANWMINGGQFARRRRVVPSSCFHTCSSSCFVPTASSVIFSSFISCSSNAREHKSYNHTHIRWLSTSSSTLSQSSSTLSSGGDAATSTSTTTTAAAKTTTFQTQANELELRLHKAVDMTLKEAISYQELLFIYKHEKENMNLINYATLLHKCTHHAPQPVSELTQHELFVEAMDTIQRKLVTGLQKRAVPPEIFAKILKSLSILDNRHKPIVILDLVQHHARYLVHNGTSSSISTTALACATFQYTPASFFRLLQDKIWVYRTFKLNSTTTHMADLCQAIAALQLHQEHAHLFELLDQNAAWIIRKGHATDLVRLMASCAHTTNRKSIFFRLINSKATRLFDARTDPHLIATAVWASSTLGYPSYKLFGLLETHAKSYIHSGASADALATMAHACSVVQFKHATTFFRLLHRQTGPLFFANPTIATASTADNNNNNNKKDNNKTDSSVQALAKALIACATLQYDVPELLSTMDERSETLFLQLACQKTNEEPNPPLPTLESEANLAARVAGAFCRLDWTPSRFFHVLEDRLDELQLTGPDTSTILYSLTVLDHAMQTTEALRQELWRRVMDMDPNHDDFGRDNLLQLAYVDWYSRATRRSWKQATPPEWKDRLLEVTNEALTTPQNQSRYKDQYSAILHELGLAHERDVPFFGDAQFLTIDFANVDQKIAVLFDWEQNFLIPPGKGVHPRPNQGTAKLMIGSGKQVTPAAVRETGPTMSKRRLLEQLGWTVVNISYFDDIDMNAKRGANVAALKAEYMLKKLIQAGAVLRPPRDDSGLGGSLGEEQLLNLV